MDDETFMSGSVAIDRGFADELLAADKTTQAANSRQYAAAAPRIEALAIAQPTGEPDADAAAIDIDSKAAWEAWK